MGLGLGLVFGGFLQIVLKSSAPNIIKSATGFISIINSGYISLLNIITIPFIIISILTTVLNFERSKMNFTVVGILAFTTFVSAIIGAGTSIGFKLNGEGIQIGNNFKVLPDNFLGDYPTIAVCLFTFLLGIVILRMEKTEKATFDKFKQGISAIGSVIFKLLDIILQLTPFGIFAIITTTVANTDFNVILTLIKFVIATYVALIIVLVFYVAILLVLKVDPQSFFKKSWSALYYAFRSGSSTATLPLTISTLRNELGVPVNISNLAAKVGTSTGQNG